MAAHLGVAPAELLGDSAPSATQGELFRCLGVNGATELVHAYAEISDADVRRSVLHMTRVLAGARAKERMA